jgi:hypothetical protein
MVKRKPGKGNGEQGAGLRGLFLRLLVWLFVVTFPLTTALAQQPQAQSGQPIYSVNAKYTQGVGPGYWPTPGSGLTLNLAAGTVTCDQTSVSYAGGTLTLAASATNYVYLDESNSCVPTSNTTGLTDVGIPIASVTTNSSSITAVTDLRTWFMGGKNVTYDAARFPGVGAGTKIANAFAVLPAAGGVVDARSLTGPQNITSNLTIPNKTTLLLGAATFTLSTGVQIILNKNTEIRGVGIGSGSDSSATVIVGNVANGAPIIQSSSSGIQLWNLTVQNNAAFSATAYVIDLSGALSWELHNVQILGNNTNGLHTSASFYGKCDQCWFNALATSPGTGWVQGTNQVDIIGGNFTGWNIGLDVEGVVSTNVFGSDFETQTTASVVVGNSTLGPSAATIIGGYYQSGPGIGNGKASTVFSAANLGTISGTTFTGTLTNTPVRANSVTIRAAAVIGTDNGSGAISGTGISAGTVNYATGAISVTYSPALSNGTTVFGTYDQTLTDTLATGTGSQTAFTNLQTTKPVIKPKSVTIQVAGVTQGTDSGGTGTLSGAGISSGTVDYIKGIINVTLTSAPASGASVTAIYTSLGTVAFALGIDSTATILIRPYTVSYPTGVMDLGSGDWLQAGSAFGGPALNGGGGIGALSMANPRGGTSSDFTFTHSGGASLDLIDSGYTNTDQQQWELSSLGGLFTLRSINNGGSINSTPLSISNGGGIINQMQIVAFSATPVFDASTGNFFSITLTSNVTSWTISNPGSGQMITIQWCQDSTGGRTVPASLTTVKGFTTPGTTASTCSTQSFWYNGNIGAWYAIAAGSTNQ